MNEMHKYMHNTFWVDNQVSFTFAHGPSNPEEDWSKSLNLSDFAAFLNDHGFTMPGWDGPNSTKQRTAAKRADQIATSDYPIFYEFPGPHVALPNVLQGEASTLVASFFRFEGPAAAPQVQQGQDDLRSTTVAQLVNLVNEHQQALYDGTARLQDGTQLKSIPIVAAAPNWYCGASGHVTTGCPLTPPIPIATGAKCSSSSGLWPIQLPDLPRELKTMTGDGVTVFVLDSLPSGDDMKRAAEAAGEHNLLLLDLINNVTFTYPALPEILDRPGTQQTMTGKDIHGKAVGFRMPDHGLFVTGIIRDIAPNTHVECIRVLNDYCAGTALILIDQLHRILQRTLEGGDLYSRDVVINMSLEIPDDEDVKTSDIDPVLARLQLFQAIQSLSARGVIFVASAGNEGDRRYMKPKGEHPNALYPAAYAYQLGQFEGVENMIPVGAVNHKEKIASYSCYPGLRGVSTYGGDVPASFTNKETHMTEVDKHTIDAVIGVYTQLSYPALSIDDPEATYPVPNAHGWAYWIGTSFATPIISAVVARALELRQRNPTLDFARATPITEAIIKYVTTKYICWPVGCGGSFASIPGPLVLAIQCHPLKENGFLSHVEHFLT